MSTAEIYHQVQSHYGSHARDSASSDNNHTIAKAFGYSDAELADVPEGADLGLSCGNPLVLARLREGETVIDLGSGAGFDVFLAAKRVGREGKAVGVDMNQDMLSRANANKEKVGATNTLFIESPITSIALPSATADCIISNCVINLVPETEKQLVFNEMFRLLKPGGRVAVSDILAKKELPVEMMQDMGLYVGCIAGASRVEQYGSYLKEAGFSDVLIVDNKHDLNLYKGTGTIGDAKAMSCCGLKGRTGEQAKIAGGCGSKASEPRDNTVLWSKYADVDFNEWIGSYHVYAVKE